MTTDRPDLDPSKLQPGDEPGVWVEQGGQWIVCPVEHWHRLLAAAEAGHTAEAPLHISAQLNSRAPIRGGDHATHEVLLASIQAESTEEISRTQESLMPRVDSEEEERFTVPLTLPQRDTGSPAPPPVHRVSRLNLTILAVGLIALFLAILLQLRPLEGSGQMVDEPVATNQPAKTPALPPSTAPAEAPLQAPVQVAEVAAPTPAADADKAPSAAPAKKAAPTKPKPRALNLAQLRDRGWASSDAGNFGEAISWFRKAVAKAPADVEANYGYGYALLKAGRPDDALTHLCAAYAADDGAMESEIRGILSVAHLSCDGM